MTYDLRPVRIAAPSGLPVSLADAKQHLRVEHADDDVLIGAYLAAAVERLDGWAGILGRCLVTQTWRAAYDGFTGDRYLRLPFPSVSAVVVRYTDTAGAEQTIPGTDYDLIDDAIGSAIVLKASAAWPATGDRADAVRVEITAGYGAAADVPAPIRAAILLMVGDLYRNRETAAVGTSAASIPMSVTVDALLAPYRRVGL